MAKTLPEPHPISFLLAERIIRDQDTGQTSVIGILNEYHTSRVPVVIHALAILVEFTGVRGRAYIRVAILNVDQRHRPIAFDSLPFDSESPIEHYAAIFRFGPLIFPTLGDYRAQLSINDQLRLERPLRIMPTDDFDPTPIV